MKKDPPDIQTLDYKAPQESSHGLGCGMLTLETLGGLFFGIFLVVAAHFVSLAIGGNATPSVIFMISAALGLALTAYLAFARHPGFLIGFVIIWSMVGLLVSLCGPIVLGKPL